MKVDVQLNARKGPLENMKVRELHKGMKNKHVVLVLVMEHHIK